jgi:GNAT superfamily N-acetyltransferase
MIYLHFMHMNSVDVAMASEADSYYKFRDKNALATLPEKNCISLKYATSALDLCRTIVRALDTENGRVAYKLLKDKHDDMKIALQVLREDSIISSHQTDLMNSTELQGFDSVLQKIMVFRGRINAFYAKVKNMKNLSGNTLYVGKLMVSIGERALAISNMVAEFAGYPWLMVSADRLLRFDYLTNAEFNKTYHGPANKGERALILKDLRERNELTAQMEISHISVIRSPFGNRMLAFVMLNQDVSKSAEELASTIANEPMLFLEHIEVAKDVARCGIGSRILRWAKATAEKKGFREMGLGGDEGVGTWEFWHKHHFKKIDTVPGVSAILCEMEANAV